MTKKTLTYSIKRWDAMLFKNSITKMPVIYVEPDAEFKKYLSERNGVMCVVRGTETEYDRIPLIGFIRPSSTTPNSRQNFYDETGYYTIILTTKWLGYPDIEKLGSVSFEIDEPKLMNAPKEEKLGMNVKPNFSKSIRFIGIASIILIIIILFVAFV